MFGDIFGTSLPLTTETFSPTEEEKKHWADDDFIEEEWQENLEAFPYENSETEFVQPPADVEIIFPTDTSTPFQEQELPSIPTELVLQKPETSRKRKADAFLNSNPPPVKKIKF